MSTLNPYAGGTIPLSPNAVPLGMNSQVGRGEWQEFLARRRELIETGMQNLQLSTGFAAQTGMPIQQAFQATSLLMPPSSGEQERAARMQTPIDDSEYNRLLGAADFYGIDNAEAFDPNELRQQIEMRRDYLVSRKMEDDPSVGGAIYDTVATFLGTTGLGAVDAVASGLQRVPFVGDALRKHTGIERYQRGLAMLEEGFTGDMIDAERASYEKFARPLQHFLGYSALVGVAAEGVGATGFAAGIANPLIRGSLQGAATGWVLEGGGDEAISERAVKIALFSGLQGLGEWGIPKIAARLSRSFPRPSQWGAQEARMGRAGTDAGTIDAEWAYFDDLGPRLIGPGGTPGGAAPLGTPRLGPGGISGTPIVPEEVFAAEMAPSMAVGPLATGPLPAAPGMQLTAGTLRPGTVQVSAGMTQFPRGQQMPTMEAAQPVAAAVPVSPGFSVVEHSVVPMNQRGGGAENFVISSPVGPLHLRVIRLDEEGENVIVRYIGSTPGEVTQQSLVNALGTAGIQEIKNALRPYFPKISNTIGLQANGPGTFRAVPQGPGIEAGYTDGINVAVNSVRDRAVLETAQTRWDAYSPSQRMQIFAVDEVAARRPWSELDPRVQQTLLEARLPQLQRTSTVTPWAANDATFLDEVALGDLDISPGVTNAREIGRARAQQELGQLGDPSRWTRLEYDIANEHVTEAIMSGPVLGSGRMQLRTVEDLAYVEELQAQLEGVVRARPELELTTAPLGALDELSATADAVAATKQGMILESPALPALAKQPTIQDADVALAAIATNPGQISVVQGVGDSAGTIRRFLQEFLPNGVGPQDFRAITRSISGPSIAKAGNYEVLRHPGGAEVRAIKLSDGRVLNDLNTEGGTHVDLYRQAGISTDAEYYALRPDRGVISPTGEFVSYTQMPPTGRWQYPEPVITTRIDILVADGRPITNKMAKEYEQFGMFRGQQAAHQGQQVTIESLGPEFSQVRSMGGSTVTVPTAELMPGKSSMIADAAPEAYIEAKSYALSRMAMEATESGLAPFDWFSDEMATQLPRYIDEFLDMKGVQGQGARGVYTASFTEARVREFKTLAPEEFAQAEAIQEEVTSIVLRDAAQNARSVSLDEVAEMKGMRWEARPNTLGGNLIDSFSGELVAFDSQEAAFAFLLDFNRTMPDYSPFSTVPVELAAGPIGMPGAGSSRAPTFTGTADDLVRDGHRELDYLDSMYAEGGGGSGMPPGELPPGAAGGQYPGGEFGALRDASFGKYRQLEVRFDRTIRHWLEPMRGYAARVTEDLNRFGIRANYWEDIVTIENASATAHNEIEPWSREFSEALSKIRNRRVRDGSVVLIGELPPEQALAAMRNAGYTQRELEGQQTLRELWERVGNEYGVRRVLDYWPHLRSADSPEQAAQKILQYDFTGPGKWFAEQVRQGGIDYREMNAEVLINKWLRGAAFSRHVAPHVDRMTSAWVQDTRIPTNLREVTSNWLSLVTTGYVPGGARIFDGIAATFQSAKIPMNMRDVEVMARWAMSNTYRGLLGGRPVAVIREMINPLLAWARIGHTRDLGGAMVRFARDAGYRQEALQRGLDGGWVMRYAYGELSQEPLRAGGVGAIPGVRTPENEFSPMQNAVREGAARVGDVFTDATNRVLPRGFNNSIIDPLKPMDKVNEFGRLIAGESGYQAMARALGEYNAARNAAGPIVDARALNAQLLQSSGAANLHESVQRSIVRMVEMGDQEGAKRLFANEVANQLARFGAMDQPPAAHGAGVVGKLGLQFGNFAIQYQSGMREGLGMSGLAREFGGNGFSKAVAGTKFAGRHAIIAGGLALAGGYTAWNFNKWFWHGSLGWGGGPMLMAMVDEFRSLGARYKELQGEPLTPVEKALLVETGQGGLGESLINPYLGTMRTIDKLGVAVSSSNPIENAAQFMMTGRMGGAEFQRQLNEATWQVAPPPAWMQGQVPQQQPVVPMGGGGQF